MKKGNNMKTLNLRLEKLKEHINEKHITIMIVGLGSVGTYLLDYLLNLGNENISVVVVGRNFEKMESDVNIVRISSLIRKQSKSKVIIESNVNLENIDQIAECLRKYSPDFIVNSSRVYSGLKYGSISWNNIRAYGIWSPLAIKYIKNIMAAYEAANSDGIVINTSYSDAIIPWLKSAGKCYPDFGSGNMNHLIPRIKFAIAELYNLSDYWNVDVMFATAHFHDVVISKEGHTEGMEQLIEISYKGKVLDIDQNKIFAKCKIAMPVDSKRNMMNASSNYDIIVSAIDALENNRAKSFFSPGVFGEIGGYPVIIDGCTCDAHIDDSIFSLDQMRKANRKSIWFDGIEDIRDGSLFYTDHLIEKVKTVFGVPLPKEVPFEKSDEVAEYIIEKIVVPQLSIEKR